MRTKKFSGGESCVMSKQTGVNNSQQVQNGCTKCLNKYCKGTNLPLQTGNEAVTKYPSN